MKVKDYFKEHKWIIPVAIAAGVLIITAIVIAVYSSGHFARGTKVNGIDVSGMSVKQLQKRIGEYSINVKERKIDEKSRDESFFEETIKGSVAIARPYLFRRIGIIVQLIVSLAFISYDSFIT